MSCPTCNGLSAFGIGGCVTCHGTGKAKKSNVHAFNNNNDDEKEHSRLFHSLNLQQFNSSNHFNHHSATKCKFGCGKKCNPGRTSRGRKFDTCCKSCAISKGSTSNHDSDCNSRNSISDNDIINALRSDHLDDNKENPNLFMDSNNQRKHSHSHTKQTTFNNTEHRSEYKTVTHKWSKHDRIYCLLCWYYGGPLNIDHYFKQMVQYNSSVNFKRSEIIPYGTIIKFPRVPCDWRELPYAKRLSRLQNKSGYKMTNNTREEWMMKIVWIVVHEYKCKVFGGFVRDFIYRGKTPHDIDIRLSPTMTITHFQSIMKARMQQIGVKFIPTDHGIMKGQLFILPGNAQLFDADFVPCTAFNGGTSCDVDASNIELIRLQSGGVRWHRRVNEKTNPNINVPTLQETTKNILLKRCLVIDSIWPNDPTHKSALQTRLRDKYEKSGWKIMNKRKMNAKGLNW